MTTDQEYFTTIVAILKLIDGTTKMSFNELIGWTTIPGQSKHFTIYGNSPEPGKPSNTKDMVKLIEFKKNGILVLTQTITYDIRDNVLSITAS